jgi:hypothetical protein
LLSASFKRKLQPKRLYSRAVMTSNARAHPQYLEFAEASKKE